MMIESAPFELDVLDLDLDNPRYGEAGATMAGQVEALDHIVSVFGVSEVISSLAVNGFFLEEPLVGIREGDRIRIIEGNRRLASCLILAGEERARNQGKLQEKYRALHEKHNRPSISPIPVIVHESEDAARRILPFLGVRHIVGFKTWDSYAKAAWIHEILNQTDLTLVDLMEMIGDNNQTIKRMLRGYRLVKYLEKNSVFQPSQSQRAGRGSNTDYPFSWVYTALDNQGVKDFIGLKEGDEGLDNDPIPEDKLTQAGLLMRFLFGDKLDGKTAVIQDSRQIGKLARHLDSKEVVRQLEKGVPLDKAVDNIRPENERIEEAFIRISQDLREVAGLVVPGSVGPDHALELAATAGKIVGQSKKIHRDLTEIATQISDED